MPGGQTLDVDSARVRLSFRRPPPDGMTVQISTARPLPLDWYRWRDALLGGPPLVPIVEGFTEPEGWSLTLAETAFEDGIRIHAFYAVFDHAAHAFATVPGDASDEVRAGVRATLTQAAPVWPDEICALVDL